MSVNKLWTLILSQPRKQSRHIWINLITNGISVSTKNPKTLQYTQPS